MASINDFLAQTGGNVEFGEVESKIKSNSFFVTISGVDHRAHNITGRELAIGEKVITTKSTSGKRYIINSTGIVRKPAPVLEVYRNG
jgi:hypothetical protein